MPGTQRAQPGHAYCLLQTHGSPSPLVWITRPGVGFKNHVASETPKFGGLVGDRLTGCAQNGIECRPFPPAKASRRGLSQSLPSRNECHTPLAALSPLLLVRQALNPRLYLEHSLRNTHCRNAGFAEENFPTRRNCLLRTSRWHM